MQSAPIRDPRADELRARYHAAFGGAEPPVPVESIAEDLLGLIVEEGDLDVSGVLQPEERRVFLNANESPQRRRFTLAHEIGHWVCQCLEGEAAPIYCRTQDVSASADRLLEREANVFAAELLMPELLMREFALKRQASIAEGFGVSEEAAGWRLYNLGLATTPPRS
jgi:Zn-dependent peptidase ImmA (M78 family)